MRTAGELSQYKDRIEGRLKKKRERHKAITLNPTHLAHNIGGLIHCFLCCHQGIALDFGAEANAFGANAGF